MKTHYLPQFLLKEFADDRLYEFDKNTGKIEPRNVGTAGQLSDFYLPDIETGLMGEHDQAACNVLRKHVYRQSDIRVPDVARRQLAEWIALFMVRVPRNYGRAKAFLDDFESDPEAHVKLIYENPEKYIQHFRSTIPEAYAEIMMEFGAEGPRVILKVIADHVRRQRPRIEMNSTEFFCEYITSASYKRFAQFLYGLRWTWLRTKGAFVIGDNPLVRWDKRTGRGDVGLLIKKVEITIPVSKSVCLWMKRDDRHGEETTICNRQRTDTLNRRQITSAVQKVYGPSRILLQSDSEYAEYGF